MPSIANDPVSPNNQPDHQSVIPFRHTVPVRANPPAVSAELDQLLFQLGVEPSLTVREAAAVLRWSYWKARRYFSQVEGICVYYRPKRYKRAYRMFTIPVSIFAREWQKMTGQPPESAEMIRQRLLGLVIQK